MAVDYDPGTSEVNQLNRIKLMMSVAFKARNGGRPKMVPDPPMYRDDADGLSGDHLSPGTSEGVPEETPPLH